MVTIQQSLEYIVKAVVTDPSSIVITSTDVNGILMLEISAAPEIIGQVIGKEGKIIKSIRTILNLAFPNQKYSLEIKD